MQIKIDYKKILDPVKTLAGDMHFGSTFTDKMFVMYYIDKKGWFGPTIKNHESFHLEPSALVYHYAQEIFEGQKAYKWKDGRIAMFRPEMNIKRFNRSAERMCMPKVDEALFMEALEKLIWEDRDFIPQTEDQSLYVRPAMIAVDNSLGARAGAQYIFFIVNSPTGCYFCEGFNPTKIWVSDKYARSVPGGVGEAKTGGNYAVGFKAMEEAKTRGCSQVLWLDGVEKKYVEEVGVMNIFFVENGKLITPALDGCILKGITRDSVITIAKELGYSVEERRIPIDEICKGIQAGEVTECFGTGTAAVISPVGELNYKERSYVINNFKTGTITKKIYDMITGIQHGEIKDKHGWIRFIAPR
ncbi:MAG: branched-chain amino acid aminotransferase [Pseudomonadota bacterium]